MGKLLTDIPVDKWYVGMPIRCYVKNNKINYMAAAIPGDEKSNEYSYMFYDWFYGEITHISNPSCIDGSKKVFAELKHPSYPIGVVFVDFSTNLEMKSIEVDTGRM